MFNGITLYVCIRLCAHLFRAALYGALTWHQPHCSTPWLQCLQTALLLSPWEGKGQGGMTGRIEGGKERKKERQTDSDREAGERSC